MAAVSILSLSAVELFTFAASYTQSVVGADCDDQSECDSGKNKMLIWKGISAVL